MVGQEMITYFKRLHLIMAVEYGVSIEPSKTVKELVEEAVLLDRKPEDLALEIGESNRLPRRQATLN